MAKITVVLPAFNEQDNLEPVCQELIAILKEHDYSILFVDDGSSDQTLERLRPLSRKNHRIHYLSFSKNFGHQNALKAGLDNAEGDCLIFMDCDLQHPPQLLRQMINAWKDGSEIVYTIRQDGAQTPFLKRFTSGLFYSLMDFLSDVSITPGRADFFLIDRKVADVLKQYDESPLFFRGVLSSIGFKQTGITYTPEARFSGQTKYNFKRMMELAIDGITSFSIKPLRLSIILGSLVSLAAMIYLFYIIYERIFTHEAVQGWASILASVLLLGGIQLISLGIMGEYLGKLFISAKNRPKYIVREKSK